MAGGKRLKNSVYGFSNPLQSVNPLPVIVNRDPTVDDISYPIGQHWINQNNNDVWMLTSVRIRQANWEPLGMDTSGAAPITKYVVDPDGTGDYITIQAALDAANAAGIPAAVYIRPAIYTENLTLYDGIDLWGAVGVADTGTCKIIGTHTPPSSGTLTIRNIFLESATDIFLSAVAGTSALILIDCAVGVTNGYTFNLPNWTGSFTGFDIGEIQSTNDGWVNNTGGATVFMVNITMGSGAGNTMIVSGITELYNVHCQCPISFQGTGTATANGGCWFDNTITTVATATVSIINSLITAGANQAISHGSANPLTLSKLAIDSTNATVIGGNGTINYGSIDFLNNSTIASTVTMVSTPTLNTPIRGWNGSILESPVVTITSDGAIITFSVERSGTGDLTVVTSKGFYNWDTSPAATIALTAGSDTSPQINYVYWLESTRTLTVSTSSFPAAEHAPLATVLCQSAASLQTEGAYKVHAWTDHLTRSDDQGHISDINNWIRNQNARWVSGVNQTFTITPQGGTPDNVILSTAAGVVLQLHHHTFPAFSAPIDYYVVNDSVTPYTIVNDLNALLTDSTGASMSNKYFSLVMWGVVSEASGDCKVFINLPGGSYNTSATVISDASKFANFTIPSEFIGTGFLIAQWNLRHQNAAGGTWTSISEIDLRGLFPGVSAGAGTAASSQFVDNVFMIVDETDSTKTFQFQASSITTATNRTMTVQDSDGTIAYLSDIVGGGLTLISSQVAAASASIDFTTIGGFDSYLLVYSKIRPATNGAILTLQSSINNGSTWLAINYEGGCNFNAYNVATHTNVNSTTYMPLSGAVTNSGGNKNAAGNVWLTGANQASESWANGTCSFAIQTTNTSQFGIVGGLMSGVTVDAYRLIFTAGNITSGRATLYGLNIT